MANVRRVTLWDKPIKLGPGREWHTKPITFSPGDEVRVSATADDPFYAGLYDWQKYHMLAGRDAGAFGFEFGTDSRSFARRITVEERDDYYVVLRVSALSFVSPVIFLRIVRDRPVNSRSGD